MSAPYAWQRWQQLSARERIVDVGAFILGLAFALYIVFAVAPPDEVQFFYLLLLPVIWIGVRHGLPWCATAILIEQVTLVALITLLGYPAPDFIAFQIFSFTVAVAGLVLGPLVTERQEAELKLRQQQAELGRMTRLATVGALGSAIVHEISQPLATLATYAHACRRLSSAGPHDEHLLTGTLDKIRIGGAARRGYRGAAADFSDHGRATARPPDSWGCGTFGGRCACGRGSGTWRRNSRRGTIRDSDLGRSCAGRTNSCKSGP